MSRQSWEAIDASRQVGWAKYFSEHERCEGLERLAEIRSKVLDRLTDQVLARRYKEAYKTAQIIRKSRPRHG